MAKTMRKVRTGSVVRTKQDKTAIVEMIWKQRHRLYRKQVRRVARFYVHDPESQCRQGDVVRIEETRPISKTKHWRLLEILERRQVAEVRPIDLESDATPVMGGQRSDESEDSVGEAPEDLVENLDDDTSDDGLDDEDDGDSVEDEAPDDEEDDAEGEESGEDEE